MSIRPFLGSSSQPSSRLGLGAAAFGSASLTDQMHDRFATQGSSQRSHLGAALPPASQGGWMQPSQAPAVGSLLPMSQPSGSAAYLRPGPAPNRSMQPSQQLTFHSGWSQQPEDLAKPHPLMKSTLPALHSSRTTLTRPGSAPLARSKDLLPRRSNSAMPAPSASGLADPQAAPSMGLQVAEQGAVDSRDSTTIRKQLGILDNHLQDLLQQASDHGSTLEQQQQAMGRLDNTCGCLIEQLQGLTDRLAALQEQMASMRAPAPVMLCSVACQVDLAAMGGRDAAQQTSPPPRAHSEAGAGRSGTKLAPASMQHTPLAGLPRPSSMAQPPAVQHAGVGTNAAHAAAGRGSKVPGKQLPNAPGASSLQQRNSSQGPPLQSRFVQGTLTFSRVPGSRGAGSNSPVDGSSHKQQEQDVHPGAAVGSQRLSVGSGASRRGSGGGAGLAAGGSNSRLDQHHPPAAAGNATPWYSKARSSSLPPSTRAPTAAAAGNSRQQQTNSAAPAVAFARGASQQQQCIKQRTAATTAPQQQAPSDHHHHQQQQKEVVEQQEVAAAPRQRPRRTTAGQRPKHLAASPAPAPARASTRSAAGRRSMSAAAAAAAVAVPSKRTGAAAAGAKRKATGGGGGAAPAFNMLSLFAGAPATPACSSSAAPPAAADCGPAADGGEDDIAAQVAAAMAQHRSKRQRGSPVSGSYDELCDF